MKKKCRKQDDEQKIVIRRDGNKTVATLYGFGEKKTAEAKCNTEFDKYDFKYGVAIAMSRLLLESC